MFIGHLAMGFAAKRAAPNTTLGLLIAAPLLLELIRHLLLRTGTVRVQAIWALLVLVGLERVEVDPG